MQSCWCCCRCCCWCKQSKANSWCKQGNSCCKQANSWCKQGNSWCKQANSWCKQSNSQSDRHEKFANVQLCVRPDLLLARVLRHIFLKLHLMPFKQAFEPVLCPQQRLRMSELGFQQMLRMRQQVQALRQSEQNVLAGRMPKRSDLQNRQ